MTKLFLSIATLWIALVATAWADPAMACKTVLDGFAQQMTIDHALPSVFDVKHPKTANKSTSHEVVAKNHVGSLECDSNANLTWLNVCADMTQSHSDLYLLERFDRIAKAALTSVGIPAEDVQEVMDQLTVEATTNLNNAATRGDDNPSGKGEKSLSNGVTVSIYASAMPKWICVFAE